MTDEQLVNTLRIAAASDDVRANLAMEVLLKLAADRIELLNDEIMDRDLS
jgi:hypothetical protein